MFNITATNDPSIGTSEQYETERACGNGLKSVANNASGAKVEELSG